MAKFSLKSFVMRTLESMKFGGEDEYKVMQYALKYYEIGVLAEDDLALGESWYEVTEEEASVDYIGENDLSQMPERGM